MILIFLLILLLSACGMSPQALLDVAEPYKTIWLQSTESHPFFEKKLINILQKQGITVVTSEPIDREHLAILAIDTLMLEENSQVVRLSPALTNYQLRLQLSYRLFLPINEEQEAQKKDIVVWRFYDYDPNLLLARDQEEKQLHQEMENEIIILLLNKLANAY